VAQPFLRPPDGPGVVYEFFAPFAHVPGKYEVCRIRSPTHGVFDAFIALPGPIHEPVVVYVNSILGRSFMRERFPECTTYSVAPGALRIDESPDGRTVTGVLDATEGPLRSVRLTIRAAGAAMPRNEPYGGEGKPLWGSRFTCWGVDLVLDAACDGRIVDGAGKTTDLRGQGALLALGSFGRIAPLART
jgi:hypothetical protein